MYDTATMVALKGRGPERGEPAIRSALRAVIWIVLGDVSEQRVARLLCRSEIIHLVGLRRSLVSLLEENSYHFIEQKRLVGRIPIPAGHRAVWQDRHCLATAKLACSIDDRTVVTDFPRLLLYSNGNRETERFIEIHIYGPFDRQAIVSAVIS